MTDFPCRDGYLLRKTRYGIWKERYFRTRGYFLYYYSNGLDEIRQTALETVSDTGYRYALPRTSYSEKTDTRAPNFCVERIEDTAFLLRLHKKRVEVKAESVQEAEAWINTLRAMSAYYKRKRLGLLRLQVFDCFLINHNVKDSVLLQVSFAGEEREYMYYHIDEDNNDSRRQKEIVYENLDGHLVSAFRLERKTSRLSVQFPVYETGSQLYISLFAPRSQTRSETQKETQKLLKAALLDQGKSPSPRGMSRGMKQSFSNTSLIEQHDYQLIALRVLSLHELQEEYGAQQFFRTLTFETGNGSSALDGEPQSLVAASWPHRAPDGSRPRPNTRWLSLFESPDSMHDDDFFSMSTATEKPLLIKALLELDLHYHEDIMQVADAESQRYEANDEHEAQAKYETLIQALQRLHDIYQEANSLLTEYHHMLEWHRPRFSLAALFILLFIILSLPETLPIFPLLLAIALLAALPSAVEASRTGSILLSDAHFAVLANQARPRQTAEIAVTVLAARNLPNSENVYAAVIHLPHNVRYDMSNSTLPKAAMLMGISSVKKSTRAPEWIKRQALEQGESSLLIQASNKPHLSSKARHSSVLFEEARNLFSGAGFTEHLLHEVLGEDDITGRNATVLTAPALDMIGASPPAADWRARWRFTSGLTPTDSSWVIPILQPLTPSGNTVPWTKSIGKILIQLYERCDGKDTLIGTAPYSLADLFSVERGTIIDLWIPMQSNRPNTSRSAVRIAIRLNRLGEHCAVEASPHIVRETNEENWRLAQTACTLLLEPEFGGQDKRRSRSYVGQYKEFSRSLNSMQDTILTVATFCERIHALCTWVHPRKTCIVLFGLVLGAIVCCLIPNRLLLAAVVAKLFASGFVKSRLQDERTAKLPDTTETRALNLLNSLPNAIQRADAYAAKRSVYNSQYHHLQSQLKLSIRFCFRVQCQLSGLVISIVVSRTKSGNDVDHSAAILAGDEASADSRQDALNQRRFAWTQAYFVLVDGRLFAWKTLSDAADERPPTLSLIIVSEPQENAVLPRSWPKLPHLFTLICFKAKPNKHRTVRPIYLGLPPLRVSDFTAALRDQQNRYHPDNTTTLHGDLSSLTGTMTTTEIENKE